MKKRVEDDVVIMRGVDEKGKVFFQHEIPTRRRQNSDGELVWQTKGRKPLNVKMWAPRDLTLKGVFLTTHHLQNVSPNWYGKVLEDTEGFQLKKLEGIEFAFKTKTVLTIA